MYKVHGIWGVGARRAGRTLRVQQARHSQVSLCNTKGLFQVLQVGLLVHSAHVDESWAGGAQKLHS